jgi:hypothetical protein
VTACLLFLKGKGKELRIEELRMEDKLAEKGERYGFGLKPQTRKRFLFICILLFD